MCWDVVRIDLNCIVATLTLRSLAYAELYITLGRVSRQFDDLKTRKKAREELWYNDYFSSYHPEAYKFIFERAR
jgi:hypothetical protein